MVRLRSTQRIGSRNVIAIRRETIRVAVGLVRDDVINHLLPPLHAERSTQRRNTYTGDLDRARRLFPAHPVVVKGVSR